LREKEKNKMRKTPILLLLWFTAVPSFAGTALKARVQSFENKDAWANVAVSIGVNKLRLDFNGPWSHGSLIYDRETALLTAVDDFRKTIYAVTPSDQATLKLLSSLGLALAESQADKGNGGGRKTFEILREDVRLLFSGSPKLAARGVRTRGMVCDQYVTELEGEKAREVWVAAPEKTAMSAEDYHTFRSLVHLALDLGGGALSQLGADPAVLQGLLAEPELPVLSILYAKGKAASRLEILSVAAQAFEPAAFDPPTGYQPLGLMDLLKPRASASASP